MKMNSLSVKNIIVEVACLLYVLLFIYAAISKIIDYETFKVQLGQSPLLSVFASWISFIVPAIELIIAVLLIFSRTRLLGLFSALSLMTMFTTYIFIVLHFSSFIPCSCGGILEKMSWNIHLIFNMTFILLAFLGLFFYLQLNNNRVEKKRMQLYRRSIAFSMFLSIAVVVVLFLSSEEIMHRNNPFIRRYMKYSVHLVHQVDLKFNSYYFSGYYNNQLYLGNYTDPLGILLIDNSFKKQQIKRISFKDNGERFRMVTIKVKAPYFYLTDGTVPCIFRGKIAQWKITDQIMGVPRFTIAEPIDSTTMVFRANSGLKGAHILGIYNSKLTPKIKQFPKLLEQQIDGIFDTDGSLLYNYELNRIIYVYFYRNEFIISDKYGNFNNGHTIDTISHAKIKVAYLKNQTERRMSAPPLIVNATVATKNNLLFVHSRVPGRYENRKMWKIASVIDVYNLNKKTYVLSFPLFTVDGSKLQSMFLTSTHLYTISGSQLYMYEFNDILKKEMNSSKIDN